MGPDTVILSPHFDDAVLSCWHVLTAPRDVLVVNVFAGEPPAGSLGWWDRLAGSSDSVAVVRERAEEDRCALALAGRTAVNLPFLDGQYRPTDQAPAEIVEALRELIAADTRVYAPAALGDHHRDHAAVRAAALALHADGFHLALYADLPHATVDGWPQWVRSSATSAGVAVPGATSAGVGMRNGGSPTGGDLAGRRWARQLGAAGPVSGPMAAAVHRLSSDAHARKLEAVHTYASQVAPLQRSYGCSLEDRKLLGLEVVWEPTLVS